VKRVEKRVEEKKVRPEAPPPHAARNRVAPATAPQPAPATRDATPDAGATEELDQVVSMLGDMDIEVEAVEDTALAEEPEKAAETEWVEEPAEAEETERGPGETADPVRMYLQEMGGVPLLTREEEVAIAKEIESGEREVREAVFSLEPALAYVMNLA